MSERLPLFEKLEGEIRSIFTDNVDEAYAQATLANLERLVTDLGEAAKSALPHLECYGCRDGSCAGHVNKKNLYNAIAALGEKHGK